MEKDQKFKHGIEKVKGFAQKIAKDSGPIIEIKFFPEKKADDKKGVLIRINKEPIKVNSTDSVSIKAAKKLTNALLTHKSEPIYQKIASDTKKAITGRDKETGNHITKAERTAALGFSAARVAVELYNVPAKPLMKSVVLPEAERRVMDKIRLRDK